jgi:hypothetical protein
MDTTDKRGATGKKYGPWILGVYFGLVSTILRLLLSDVAFLSKSLAAALAFLITGLTAYPIMVHYVEYRRSFWNRSGQPWSLPVYVLLAVGCSVAFYLIGRYFNWR